MSLPRLAVAEPCDGEQLPALLSGLENVRCDTAAAAEGQADKEWAWERVWSEGRGCLQTLSSPLRGKGLRREPRSAGSAALRAPPAPCLASLGACVYFQPRGEKRRVGGWVGASFPPKQLGTSTCHQRGLAESIPRRHPGGVGHPEVASGRPCWLWVPALLLLGPCSATGAGTVPGGPRNRRQSWGVGLCRLSPHQQPPCKGLCGLAPFGRCTVRVALPRAPSCLPVNL